mgnify:CR=1 FL=1
MEDAFAILMQRIHEKDPALTPPELEKEVAHCIGAKINELIREHIGPAAFLQEAIKNVLGLSCEITPSLSLYVNVTTKPGEETFNDPFSSLAFEKTLETIMEKDFSTLPDEFILQLTDDAINAASKLFLNSVLLSHPLLTKIFQRFTDVFHEQLTVVLRDPVRTIINMGEPPQSATNSFARPGMYL